ncbi:MAG TPA: hypothetical protein PLR76_11110 [Hyphomonas sp.]|nr:hypothetical protein [Hyphomonas sp.]MCA8903678.1 hypothetical protein [Hyphomonas sp.]MCB9969931.1 hypothetical protein [Hyphomonas sp.]HPE48941.1 hypothetical protein [Hyphomonas sp.]
MKGIDLIWLAPAIAFAGGLTGLMQHQAHPANPLYLGTSIALLLIGVLAFAGLFLLVRPDQAGRDDSL